MSNKKALGMIETKGLTGLIEASDAAVKAADVDAVDYEQTTGALTIIKIRGTVGAVQSSVEAGAEAAQKVGELIGSHVIPNPYEYTETMVTPPEDMRSYSKEPTQLGDLAQKKRSGEQAEEGKPQQIELELEGTDKEKDLLQRARDEGLDELKGYELRFIARRIKNFPMSKSDIRVAGKGDLLDSFEKIDFELDEDLNIK